MKNKRVFFQGFRWLIFPIIAFLCFFYALTNLENGQQEEGRKVLEEAIRYSCAACYAEEGEYPSELSYIIEKYGIQIDEDRYMVDYRPVASNLMPDITVLEK